MVDKVKMGIVGCGMVSKNVMTARKFAKIKDIDFVACADTNVELATRFAKKHKIKEHHGSLEALLEKGDVDAVYLAVPHFLHVDLVSKALKAGKHVFCEKPIATSMEDGLKLCNLAKKEGLKFGVNYQYRYDKGLHSMVKTIQNGNLGEIYHAAVRVPWYRDPAYFEKSKWHKKWETSGGGTLITHTSHAIDILAWALGKPSTISGECNTKRYGDIGVEVEENAAGVIKFESGAIATILGSQVTKPSRQNCYWTFCGEHGTIKAKYLFSMYAKVKYRGLKKVKVNPPRASFLAIIGSFRGFAAWVLKEIPYLTPGWEALKALCIVKAIYRSNDDITKVEVGPLEWWH